MIQRPRRNRASPAIRNLVREHTPAVTDLVLPIFVRDGAGRDPIPSLPGVERHGLTELADQVRLAWDLGIQAVALFPRISDIDKDPVGSRAADPAGLVPRAIAACKLAVPGMVVISDVALDPYSSIGHDGVAEGGKIVNDPSLARLAAQAVTQARAGADVVAPSDMMDGRVAAIRTALDAAQCQDTLICSYAVKYASALYGPFRQALDSAPRPGQDIPADKTTYQMDPANRREALREIRLDESEGADWLLVKPGLHYLDIVHQVRAATTLPVAAYHVSGEYAMLMAAAANGWIDKDRCLYETAVAFRRAGADLVFTYAALELARLYRRGL